MMLNDAGWFLVYFRRSALRIAVGGSLCYCKTCLYPARRLGVSDGFGNLKKWVHRATENMTSCIKSLVVPEEHNAKCCSVIGNDC